MKVFAVLPNARYPGHTVQANATSVQQCWPVLEQIYTATQCTLGRIAQHWPALTFHKGHVTGFCEGNSPVTGEFPAQRASNVEKVPFDGVIMMP